VMMATNLATNQTKSRAPELSPTPEEPLDPPDVDEKSRPGAFSRSRSALNLHLQERLLSCGNFGALLDDEDRLGRRPSLGSLSVDGSNRDRDSDDGGYFNLKRVVGFLSRVNFCSRQVRKVC
jgi:hypothetical protein